VALITHAEDDVGASTGELRSGAITDDTRPQLHGTAQADSTINIQYRNGDGEWIDGVAAVANASGRWNWTAPELEAGNWEFRASAGGNWGQPFVLDIAAAGSDALKAVISQAEDNFGEVTGPLLSGAITDDATPTLNGRAEANSSVIIRWSNGNDTFSTTVQANGSSNWQWTPDPALAPGEWAFTTQTGSNSWSAPFTLQLITPGSHVPLIAQAWDNVALGIGEVTSGNTTNDNQLTLSGSGEANRLLNIYDDGKLLTSVTVGADGQWRLDTPVLPDGDHSLSVSYGDYSSSLASLDFEVDTKDPDGPGLEDPVIDPASVTHAQDDFNAVTGQLLSGAMTDDTTPTLHGTGASSRVLLSWTNGTNTYSTTVTTNSNGNWQWAPDPALAPGEWIFTTRNTSDTNWGTPFTLEIITPGSHVPLIAQAWDDVEIDVGPVTSGGKTNDSELTLSGRGEANRLLNIYDDGKLLASVTVGADGNWELITPVLENGEHSLSVSYGDYNTGLASLDFTVDTGVARITHAQDDFDVATGQLLSGAITDDATPTLYGTGVASNSMVLSWTNGAVTHSTTVTTNNDGGWQWAPDPALAPGEWIFTTRNTSDTNWSTPFTLEIITPGSHVPLIARAEDDVALFVGPVASGATTNDNELTLSGRGEANRLLNIYDNGELLTSVTVGADGQWLLDTPVLEEGDHSLSVSYGNFTASLASLDFEVDTKDPDGPGDLTRNSTTHSLSYEEIIADGQKSLWIDNNKHQFKVDGNEGDVLQLENLTLQEWLAIGEVTIAGTQYDVWSHQNSETELLIQQGIISDLEQA